MAEVDPAVIREQAFKAADEICEAGKLTSGQLFVVGCSTSEVLGEKIGTHYSMDVAKALYSGIAEALSKRGVLLAAQCCEHLNRALILEREAAEKYGYEPVNVCPWEHGGGSFATTAYRRFEHPVAVEHIRADAGIDIGLTMIGMHLKDVAVPVRLSVKKIGEAPIVCARTRPKLIGGERARYE